MSDADPNVERAAEAIRDGDLVVYPTETVYGLGADALNEDAVERVFEAKGRSRDDPVSLAVPDPDAALEFVRASDRERRFVREFLPGPVTVVCRKREVVPDALTGGRERVGVRVPDHPVALALLREVAPVTSTSANVSGRPSATRVADLDPEIRDAVAVVLDGGETPGGTGSTVVNVETGEIHRRGENAAEVEAWLREQRRTITVSDSEEVRVVGDQSVQLRQRLVVVKGGNDRLLVTFDGPETLAGRQLWSRLNFEGPSIVVNNWGVYSTTQYAHGYVSDGDEDTYPFPTSSW